MKTDAGNNLRSRLLGATVSLGVGAGAVAWLSPEGTGGAGPAKVVEGVSASGYRLVTKAVANAPSWASTAMEIATDGTLVLLGLLLVLVWWTALRRGDARGVAGTVMIGVGTVAAYAISETVKLTVIEERPCRVVRGAAAAIAECPEVGDWSFPSNHATLAAGLAVGLALFRPRLAAVTLPLAAVAALLRVMVGVHYPHDVLAGVILAAGVVAAVLLALTPPAVRLVSPLIERLGRNDSAPEGRYGRRPAAHAGRHRAGPDFGRSLQYGRPTGAPPAGPDHFRPFRADLPQASDNGHHSGRF
ncbi:phosphatase PAP2 family protein [Streptosporangium sp. NBC_01810]|uniref:phosphatase PAP2 family protein n=1 Tax=Streptosporangium sp. NBC_01810 TaxID=2975951 RepID=UPI002DD7A29D|nr:phosphatase PAP2 family protein [Streptosporangium sp. NBC_01810]WSA23239.1 phosphatase PAP2 family protein [Streptosporangium sp. NBC_01810]